MNISEISDRLFCARRLRGDFIYEGQLSHNLSTKPFIYGAELDRLKISMCAPLRRLQQKTQVFPLDVKAASRNRLTHSLEVSEYSRIIAFEIVKKVKEVDLSELQVPMMSCLYNSSMLHDIGNPPYGHFGESLIRSWLKGVVQNPKIKGELSEVEIDDLLTFNGNAQGIRLMHSIQDLNLTLGQYSSVIKVPFTIRELLLGKGKGFSGNGIHGDFYSWSYANAGIFLSEKPLLDAIREFARRDSRHPFATIIEYADDLAYVLADLEDAFDRGLVDRLTILRLCENILNYPELKEFEKTLDVGHIRELFAQNKGEALFYIRDVLSYAYIRDLSDAIALNFEKYVETGEPDFSLGNYPGITALKMLKNFEYQAVYNHFEVQTLDLSGASYMKGLFTAYEKLLFERVDDFRAELWARGGDPFCKRIASRISRRHREAYLKACEDGKLSEIYLRIRLLVDYISGMTDTFAASEYRVLNGIY